MPQPVVWVLRCMLSSAGAVAAYGVRIYHSWAQKAFVDDYDSRTFYPVPLYCSFDVGFVDVLLDPGYPSLLDT